MSKGSSLTLPLLVALGAGALAGLSAVSQRDKLPALGAQRPVLDASAPLPVVEIALGVSLAEAGGRLRGTVEQVPGTIRESLGFAPHQLCFKEDLKLAPDAYEIRLKGLAVASGRLRPERLLALATGLRADVEALAGEPVVEPASGRAATWIAPEDEGQARLLGFDVIEPSFALALHADTVLRRHLHELLSREETYRLLDRAKQAAPRTVDELVGRLEVGLVQKVLQNLLREQVALRDLPFVLELLSDASGAGTDPLRLTEAVRLGLARQLCANFADADQVLSVLPLGPRWEQLRNARPTDPQVVALLSELRRAVDAALDAGARPILVAPSELRASVRRLLERELPDLPVLAEEEVEEGFEVRVLDLGAAARA